MTCDISHPLGGLSTFTFGSKIDGFLVVSWFLFLDEQFLLPQPLSLRLKMLKQFNKFARDGSKAPPSPARATTSGSSLFSSQLKNDL